MTSTGTFSASYYFRTVALHAIVASSSVVFAVYVLLFLHAQLIPHELWIWSNDTVKEMIGYAEFFLVTFACYCFAASLTYWQRKLLWKLIPSLVPIILLGSLVLGVYSALRLSSDPSLVSANEILVVSMLTAFIAGVSCLVSTVFIGQPKN